MCIRSHHAIAINRELRNDSPIKRKFVGNSFSIEPYSTITSAWHSNWWRSNYQSYIYNNTMVVVEQLGMSNQMVAAVLRKIFTPGGGAF